MSAPSLQDILQQSARSKRRPWVWLILLALLAAGAWRLLPAFNSGARIQYQTETVQQGRLSVSVSASGTLQPVTSVDVGSELSGTLASVLAQENDLVRKGQLLATLDTEKLQDAVKRAEAALAGAQAAVRQAEASLFESTQQRQRLRQMYELSQGGIPSRHELDAAHAAWLRADAALAGARANVQQAQAQLKTDRTNLGKASIRSPIDGVVLTRKVEPGQTVAAALNTPVLFTLAENLKQMELQIKVDEADVSQIKNGQPASFTVSGWPGRQFPASIRRIGLGSAISENVVTYKTVLDVKNEDLALRPGMSANATIITAQRDNALLVPNAALRFTPPQPKEKSQGGIVSALIPKLPPQARKAQAAPDAQKQVWVVGPQGPQAIAVQTGLSNGRQTEITGGEVRPGMALIVDMQEGGK
ncbi:efflux RND transporter periplasmic adaptor subunit [Massilia sp. W12]|uniref:efflux RND transporter periplasmic adaptor subunit n=1 Tax=Massilia sp. W12 TaxID=3126507 RepID=UPI0030D1DBA5